MSDWLSIIIVILIIGIVLDGVRRARNSRKNELRLSKNARKVDRMFEKEAEVGVSSELPSGGARSRVASDETLQRENPVQESLELDDPVPMLMDTIIQADKEAGSKRSALDNARPDTDSDDEGIAEADATVLPQNGIENSLEPSDASHIDERDLGDKLNERAIDETDLADDDDAREPQIGELHDLDSLAEAAPLEPNKVKPETTRRSFFSSSPKPAESLNQVENSAPKKEAEAPAPEEIMIVNVIARNGKAIPGQHLLDVLSSEKLKYGHMGIFHRHRDNDGDAPVLYSIANIVEPGSFNFAQMKHSETPGICIFLTLPTAGNAINAYDDMISTARNISARLACELSDENRNSLTKQAIEHGRQRVVEFERKNKLKKNTHI